MTSGLYLWCTVCEHNFNSQTIQEVALLRSSIITIIVQYSGTQGSWNEYKPSGVPLVVILPRLSPTMKLNVIVYNKTRNFAGHTIPIEIPDKARVSAVKKAIEDATEVPPEIQWIVFGVRHLEDDVHLEEVGIQDGYTIYSVPTYVEIPEIPNL